MQGMTVRKARYLALCLLLTAGVCLAGCRARSTAADPQGDRPACPLYASPTLVRVQKESVLVSSMERPLANAEERQPGAGLRFIAVGFPIGDKRPLTVKDYHLDDGSEMRLPLAVGCESPGQATMFYDPKELADPFTLGSGQDEALILDEESGLLRDWRTPRKVLVLLYETPRSAKALTLHHGEQSFPLEPDAGQIGKQPVAAK